MTPNTVARTLAEVLLRCMLRHVRPARRSCVGVRTVVTTRGTKSNAVCYTSQDS